MHKDQTPFLTPREASSPLGRDQIVSRSARVLREFHNIDITSFAEAVLRAHGATAVQAREFAPSAARYELARRRAFA